jgi:hypothetical protein
VAGDAELAGFYQQRFREEFQPAFDAWQATQPLTNPDAPLTPFALREYRLADADRATRLNRAAGARSDAASAANHHADQYLLAVVLFATALFFAGISGKVRSQLSRELLLGRCDLRGHPDLGGGLPRVVHPDGMNHCRGNRTTLTP